MSEKKDNKTDKPKGKDKTDVKDKGKVLESKETNSTTFKIKRLQLCAWILLTLGLCILVISFYMAVLQNSNCNDIIDADDKFYDAENSLKVIEEDINFGVDNALLSLGETASHSIRSGRFGLNHFYKEIENNANSCEETSCQIVCANVTNAYAALHDAIKETLCPSIDVLLLERQDFPLGGLKNYWRPSNISIYEVVIRFSNITRIRSNAFNSPLFRNTLVLSLTQMNITKVESGALLGLYRLKYLTIISHVYEFQPAILQPVQTTLVNLKLNSNLKINGNKNFCGVSFLDKLVYLDLSNNIFTGSLGKNLFKATPNLKYLVIVESQIESVEGNAFEDLAKKLLFVNLSGNLLTTLAAEVLEPILLSQKISMINLAHNDWICNCELKKLSELYKKYRLQFIDGVYCKGPHHLYGVSLEELDFSQQNCLTSETTVQDIEEERESTSVKTTTSESNGHDVSQEVESSSDFLHSDETTESPNTLKMRCFDSTSYSPAHQTREAVKITSEEKIRAKIITDDAEYLQFPAPSYDFELQLIPENNSVIVSIDKPSEVLVIWFSEQLESSVVTYGDTSLDYECMRYSLPELIVGPLQENTTYTFCLISSLKNDISPFNCLPLYVPPKSNENIWISEDNKQFTIGILCLIFLLSTIAGGLIAYFGIKTYPDLLEGSKNVLVVKKPDQACYVATISETDYQKQSTLKKKKQSTKEVKLKKQSSIKLPLPDTPPPELSASTNRMSVKDLVRLSSMKSSSTCFEETLPNCNFVDDKYETPRVCSDEYTVDQRNVPNQYGMSPTSPPPLPKRNSNVSNSPTLVINRFSSNYE